MKTNTIMAISAGLIAVAGIFYAFNKKSKGSSAKSAGEPKCETHTPAAPVQDAEREKPKRAHRTHINSRVEINQPNSQECNNFVSLPDGIIVVTDKGVTGAFEAMRQPEQGKRRPEKDGHKHRGGRGKKKSGNSYMPNHKELFYLLQKGRNGKLTPEEEVWLNAELKAAKGCYDPQESRKARNQRRGGKRA